MHGDFSSLAWRVNLGFGTLAALFAYLLADQELLNYFVVVLAKLVIKMLTAGGWITPLELVCYWLYAQSDKTQVLLAHLHLPPNCLPTRRKILLALFIPS